MSLHIELDAHTTIYDLFKRQLSTDVKFICSDGEVEAHSLVLKANSKWFEDHSNTSAIALFNHPRDTVIDFLTLLYKGSGNFDDDHSFMQLLTLFECTYQINQINGIRSDEDRDETDIESPLQIQENPAKIVDHPVEKEEHPVEIGEHPIEIGEQPVEIGEHPGEIGEHPVEIGEQPVEIGEQPVEIGEHPADIREHPVEIGEQPAHIREHPVEIKENPTEIEEHPSASDSLPSRLLRNPFALHTSLLKKKIDINRESSSSPVLLEAKDLKDNEPSKNCPQVGKTNSQLSDSSDVCIVESPPVLVEILDTLTQDLVPPLKAEVEEDDVTPDNLDIEHSSPKRKADQTVDCIRADVITSDDTDVEARPAESLSKRKKTHTRTAQVRKHQEDEDSDDSEISLPRRRRIQKSDASEISIPRRRRIQKEKDTKKEQRNCIRFSSTDDEDVQNTLSKQENRQINEQNVDVNELEGSSSKNTNLETRVMEFKSVKLVQKRMANFCFVCEDYTPLLKKHYGEHKWTRWSQPDKCPSCPQKFGNKTMLKIHLGKCKGGKK